MRRLLRTTGSVAVGTAVGLLAYGAAGADATEDALGPGLVTVEMTIDKSLFDVEALTVHAGTTVEFVLHNTDFIAHELVVGDDAVHAAHENGTHPKHPPVPGEVSLAPGETGLTVYTFDEPGTVRFACHLPGHVAYGMEGTIRVV